MRKYFWFGLPVAFLTGAMLVAGCGDDTSYDSENTGHYDEISSIGELYACDENFEGDSVFIVEEKVSLACHYGTWYELEVATSDNKKVKVSASLKYAADDTLSSLSGLPACTDANDRMTVYVASFGGYLICDDEEWAEIDGSDIPKKPKSSSSSLMSSSSSAPRIIDGSIGTLEELAEVPCNSKSENDTAYVRDEYLVYICNDGAWDVRETKFVGYSSMSRVSSSSANLKSLYLGKCDAAQEGILKTDSTTSLMNAYGTPYFKCSSGLWMSVLPAVADTMGWGGYNHWCIPCRYNTICV